MPIESPGCFPALTVWENMMLQAANLRISGPEEAVIRDLKTVRMEGAAGNKYKNCSLDMKQRVGIAIGLVGCIPVCPAYPVYNLVTRREQKRIAPEMLRLTDGLMK